MSSLAPVKGSSEGGSFLFLGLVAALFTAIYKTLDNLIIHTVITTKDNLTAASAYLVVGGWTGALLGFMFAELFGRQLTKGTFRRIVFNNRKLHLFAFVAGSFAAISTFFLLWGNRFGDPGALAALAAPTLVYVATYEIFTKQVGWRETFLPVTLGMIGGSLAAFNGSLGMTATGIFLVLVVSNGFGAISEIADQKGAKAGDSMNLFVWRFLWLAITGTVLAFALSEVRGTTEQLLEAIMVIIRNLDLIALVMFFVFFGISLKIILKNNYPVSKVLILLSIHILLAFPMGYFGELYYPGIFGINSISPEVWMIRISGAFFLGWSIWLIARRKKEEEQKKEEEGKKKI